MKISDNFTLDDAIRSETALRNNINNNPPEEFIDNIITAARKLEYVRYLLGDNDLIITSWYRCPKLNKLVGGAKASSHLSGFAIDFKVASLSPLEVSDFLANRNDLEFDQIINEFGQWTHISFDPMSRYQVLSVYKKTGYVQGIVADNDYFEDESEDNENYGNA